MLAATAGAAAAAGLAAGHIVTRLLHIDTPAAVVRPALPAEPDAATTESTQLMTHIIESMEGGVMTVSSAGSITSFNPVAQRTLGHDAHAVVGKHFSAVFADVPANAPIRDMVLAALRRGRTYSSVEVSAAGSDGRPVSLGVTISPLRGEGGWPRGIVLTFKNVADLNRLREQVRRTDQLASLGRLAAGVAHEIRNPLGALHGLVELIQEDLASEDPKRQYTVRILRTIDQLNTLVENLLELSQPPVALKESCDVRDIARDAVQLCTFESQDRRVFLREDYEAGTTAMLADRETLSRAVINILRNAFQATPEDGTVSVSVQERPAAAGAQAPQVVVTIANTGSYISMEDRRKLFSPFFTTKPNGTGLGLAIAHQIVSAHSGQIEVESDPEAGTAFRIVLPGHAAVDALTAISPVAGGTHG